MEILLESTGFAVPHTANASPRDAGRIFADCADARLE
jgi:hypothetical protein